VHSCVSGLRLEEGLNRYFHELSRETCRRWEAIGRDSEQQQGNSGHPHHEAGGSEGEAEAGIGVGISDGVERERRPLAR